MKTDVKTPNVEILGATSFNELRARGRLLSIRESAKIIGYGADYLRRLCRQEPPKIAHVRFMGRYYMTPAQITGLLQVVNKRTLETPEQID